VRQTEIYRERYVQREHEVTVQMFLVYTTAEKSNRRRDDAFIVLSDVTRLAGAKDVTAYGTAVTAGQNGAKVHRLMRMADL